MSMHEEWTDTLSDYLDGELAAAEREAVEAHLRGCPDCSAVLSDLKRVVAQAKTVEPRPPAADLWAGIEARIETSRHVSVTRFPTRERRRIAFTVPQLAAAAALVAAVSGGLVWQVADRAAKASATSAGADNRGPNCLDARDARSADLQVRVDAQAADTRIETVGLAEAQYDAAVSDLELALKKGRGRLDASTIAIVEHNLQIIDQAIEQAREALVTDPANSYLSGYLVETRRRKLDLLRRATALTTETN